ncbi:MAG: hypothetical protein SGI83_13315 [Bacteroidota bacterium]|nr:hypothetical protein [Bacteroidota bacterium]
MSKAKFFAMKLNFQDLKNKMGDAHFTGLIFQPYVEDTETKKDEYTLISYAMYDNLTYPTGPGRFTLYKETGNDCRSKTILELGNLPFPRDIIQNFINSTPNAPFLYLIPNAFNFYVHYTVTTDPALKAFGDYELKPSPPAPPEM